MIVNAFIDVIMWAIVDPINRLIPAFSTSWLSSVNVDAYKVLINPLRAWSFVLPVSGLVVILGVEIALMLMVAGIVLFKFVWNHIPVILGCGVA